jgi:hypothetical protein
MIPAVAGRGIFVAGGRPPPGKLIALLAREAWSLRHLGPRVAVFYLRSLWTAARTRDEWTLASAARPRELAPLLEAARGLGTVVEMGTGTAWSAAALALADSRLVIFTYDPIVRHQRDLYLSLLRPEARSRIHLLGDPDADRAKAPDAIDLLFIDSSHERDATIATFESWKGRVRSGGYVAFHDYGNPRFPGVTAAVDRLALQGHSHGYTFVWRKP